MARDRSLKLKIMSESKSFTGRSRQRQTRPSVKVADRVARLLISVGGIATILAVLGVFLFLVWVVAPLFVPAEISNVHSLDTPWSEEPAHLALDEYGLLGWVLFPSGRIEVLRLDSGERLIEERLFPDGQMTSWSFLNSGAQAVFGLSDGSVQLASIDFAAGLVPAGSLDPALRERLDALPAGGYVTDGEGVVQRLESGQYRRQRLEVEMKSSQRVAHGPVRRVAHALGSSGTAFVALAERGVPGAEVEQDGELDGHEETSPPPAILEPSTRATVSELALFRLESKERSNFLTGETTVKFTAPVELPYEPTGTGVPSFLGVSGGGGNVYVGWSDGHLLRVDATDPDQAFVAERGRLTARGSGLSAFGFVLGNTTLIWGDSEGRLAAGFPVRIDDFKGDGLPGMSLDAERARNLLVEAKDLARGSAAARSLAASSRSRLILSGFDNGEVALYNVTNASQLTRVRLPTEDAVTRIAMGPKEDILAAFTAGRLHVASLDPRYSEASFNALFRKSWYEGYPEPVHSWQSSSATDDFEPKHSLMPLIFGTLKATLYSVLFGAPLALLAAVFTSEFLDPRARSAIKPTIELMASLPSVVLGFLAALVIAPWVELVVPATLATFVTLPVAFLLGAQIWQLLPTTWTLRFDRWRIAFVALAVPFGVWLAALLGPLVESLFFAGDLEGWLAWEPGMGAEREPFRDATGGWLFVTVPLAALLVTWLLGRYLQPLLRDRSAGWSRQRLARFDLGKMLLGLLGTFALAWLTAALLSTLGFDPRGGFVDTYVQRNAMIVGFVMGFAIIPIIYTLAEDALSAVPEHLRSASLGAGATRWQTATRIVIPTAMSGLFSALMVGLGRAVGETMIVLMAAGNTPVMSWNIFEGFRTLSANIAVELPEAVQGSTHYRTLFLAALVLFVMTFVVNTVAEIVRLRFRKRAYQL